MNRLIRPATWIAAIAVTLVLLGAAAARRRSPVASSAPPPPPEVSVVTVVPETVTARYEYVGQAEASRRVEVRALVTGVIVARPYVEGTDAAAGTPLLPGGPTAHHAAYPSAPARVPNAGRTLGAATSKRAGSSCPRARSPFRSRWRTAPCIRRPAR